MKKYFGNIFAFFVIITLIFFIIKDIDFQELGFYLGFMNPFFFFLAFLSYFAVFLVWTFRWKYFFKQFFSVDYSFLIKVLFAGAFFNTITPGAGIGGEPFKAYFISKKYKKPKNKILGVVLADKFFHLLTVSFLVILCIIFLLIYINIPGNLKLILEIILIFILLILSLTIFFILKKANLKIGILFKRFYALRFVKKHFESAEHFERYINKKVREFSRTFGKVVKNKKNIRVGISLSLLYVLFEVCVSYFLFLSFGISVNFLSVMVVVVLGIIIGTGSFSPGGVGVVEGIMVFLYSAMGINFSLALLVAIVSRMIYYFFSLFVGSMCLLYLRSTLNNR